MKNDSIINPGYKREIHLFDGQCSILFRKEYEYLILNKEKLGNKKVRLYFYLKILCRKYKAPPSLKTLKNFFPYLRLKEIPEVLHLPTLDEGPYWYLPKIVLRELLRKGSDSDLLVFAYACYKTGERGTFQFRADSSFLPVFQVRTSIYKLKNLGFTEQVWTPMIMRNRKGQKYRWTILK